jgi:NADP-dependent 3-hydroxy acid dehydrogenase YdfG
MTTETEKPVALVVGATGGIGEAVATVLADRYRVGLAGRDEVALQKVADTLPGSFCWRVDLSDVEGASDMPAQLSELSLLVHCAGLFAYGTISETPMSVWREVFEVNLFGVAELTRRLLPALRATRGRIIVVNSTAVSGSPASRAAYAASKAALRSFANALHQEELNIGIRVTSVYPGRVATRTQQAVCDAEGRPYEPEEHLRADSVAEAIRWVITAPADAHITEFEVKPTWRVEE